MNKMNIKALAASTLALALTIGGSVYASPANAAAAVINSKQNKAVARQMQGKSKFSEGLLFQSEQLESLLGITRDELKAEMTSGTSLADLADQKGVDVQQLIDMQVNRMATRIDKELAAGTLTQTEYDEAKAKITELATRMVTADFRVKDLKDSSKELASLLGITPVELKSSLKSGKSLADLAADKGVDVQQVIDQQVKIAKAKLDQQLIHGQMTQAEHDKRSSDLTNFVTKYVRGEFLGKEAAIAKAK